MQLKLLAIDEFIQRKNIKRVTNSDIPSKSYARDGLWSEDIFGRVGGRERSIHFGYIDLRTKIIHPAVYQMLKTVSPTISGILNEKRNYVFKDGKFVIDENGETGLSFLLAHFHELKFLDIAKPNKIADAKFLDSKKNDILIDKILVLPAAIRDIDISKKGARNISEINTFYRSLLYLSNMISGDDMIDSLIKSKLQSTVIDINKWIQGTMKGKQGLFRNAILKKTVDYSTRMVLSSSPDIKLGYIGVPWHTLISIYEPMFTNRVNSAHSEFEKEILKFLGLGDQENVDAKIMIKFVTRVNAYPSQVSSLLQHQIKEIISEFIDDQVVVAKRDPAIHRNSWFSAKPIMTDGGVITVNSLDLGPIGGDCVTGPVLVYDNQSGSWIERVFDISEFPSKYKCSLVNKITREDGIVVSEFIVDDDVYTRGIDVTTGQLRMSKIYKWWIHENLSMFKVSIKQSTAHVSRIDPFECSSDNSLIGLDPEKREIVAFSPSDITSDSNLMLLKDCRKSKDFDQLLSTGEDLPEVASNIARQNQNGELEIIPVSKLDVKPCNTTTAYDFTVDPNQRSFLTASRLIAKNSDGDTIQLCPLFTKEAKKTATEKMNPRFSKSKWVDVVSTGGVAYNLSLDSIAAVYNATEV